MKGMETQTNKHLKLERHSVPMSPHQVSQWVVETTQNDRNLWHKQNFKLQTVQKIEDENEPTASNIMA